MKTMKTSIASALLVLACATAWALPTNQEVEAAVQAGRYAQAETMMSEVVAAKPGSAKAHYVYAEILAHNANFAKASAEASKARELDPKIAFTQPDKFEAFERMLAREQAQETRARTAPATPAKSYAPAAATAAPAERGGLPGWVWGVGLLAIGFFLWRGFNRSRSAPASAVPSATMGNGYATAPAGNGYGAPYNAGMAPGYGSGYGPGGVPAAAPRAGNGMLGTGLAVAGGVAGGMLLDQMLHSRQGGVEGGHNALSGLAPGSADLAPTDDSAARALEDRPVDFGNGDDWDAGGGSGSVDMGGGSDDGWN